MSTANKELPTFKPGQSVWCSLTGKWHFLENCHPLTMKAPTGGFYAFDDHGRVSLGMGHLSEMPVLFNQEQKYEFTAPIVPEPNPGEWCWFFTQGAAYNQIILAKYERKDASGYYHELNTFPFPECVPCPLESLPPHIKKMIYETNF